MKKKSVIKLLTILIVALAGLALAQADRDALITDFIEGFTGGTVPLEEATGEVREFTLEVTRINTEIAPDVFVEQWAFGFTGEEPSVPGPEIRVKQGDLVRITLNNTDILPHTIHPHGIISLAQEMDGVPATSRYVMPGESYTYEFVATNPGTHAYHCHVQTNLHLDFGMYGAIIVEPSDDSAKVWDKEFSMVVDEWDSNQDPNAAIHESNPNYFLVNGKAFPLTEPFEVLEGETALFRITNVGYEPHALHLHGMSFLVVAKDGYDLPQPYQGDILAIAPGERLDILIKGRDGIFPFHDHRVDMVTNNGVYPGGMLALIIGSEARTVSDSPLSIYAQVQVEAQAEASTMMTEVAAEGPLVRIVNFGFDTPELRIKAGTTVTWVNEDPVGHTVTEGIPGNDPAGRAFDSSRQAEGDPIMMEQGDTWSYTFNEPGEYAYYCLPHPFMTAKVIIE